MHHLFRRQIVFSFAIIAGSILVLGAALYFLFFSLSAQSEEIIAAKAAIAERTSTLEALTTLKKEAAEALRYKGALDRILVSRDQLLDFPAWLSSLARGRRVEMQSAFVSEGVDPGETNAGYVGFSIYASGGAEDIIAFLEDAELKAPGFLVGLESFDLSGGGSINLTAGVSDYRISSKGKVYFK